MSGLAEILYENTRLRDQMASLQVTLSNTERTLSETQSELSETQSELSPSGYGDLAPLLP